MVACGEMAEFRRRIRRRQWVPECSLRKRLRSRPKFRRVVLQRGFAQTYCAQLLTQAGLPGTTIAPSTTVLHDAFHADAEKEQ